MALPELESHGSQGEQEVRPYLLPTELIARQPEASQRFRHFISRCMLDSIEHEGMTYGHIELAAISDLGTMIHLRRIEGLATEIHENDYLLEIGSLNGELEIATIRTVRESKDGDGASMHILCDTPDKSFVIELSQNSCTMQDLVAGTDSRLMHYLEMFNRAEAVRLQL